MLDDVGDVHGCAIDAGPFERPVEQAARRADKRTTGRIFGVARLLSDQHQVRFGGTLAEHRLGAALPQLARPAAVCGRAEAVQRGPIGN
jgi:hypothetical protein